MHINCILMLYTKNKIEKKNTSKRIEEFTNAMINFLFLVNFFNTRQKVLKENVKDQH